MFKQSSFTLLDIRFYTKCRIFLITRAFCRQSMVTGLQQIDKIKPQVQDVHVPFEVFDYIDQGKNPQLYTKDCIEKALTKNEEVKGKIDAYRKFKMNMLLELHKTFPNEVNMYRALRGDGDDNDNDIDGEGETADGDAEVDD